MTQKSHNLIAIITGIIAIITGIIALFYLIIVICFSCLIYFQISVNFIYNVNPLKHLKNVSIPNSVRHPPPSCSQ